MAFGEWRRRSIEVFGAVVGTVGAVAAALLVVLYAPERDGDDPRQPATEEIADLERAVEDLSGRLEFIEDQPPPTGINPGLPELAQSIERVDDRLSAIEASIVESPGRALELPILRSDLEDLSERMREDRADAAADVDDVRTLVYASVAAIVLSLAGLLASTFVKRRFDQG